VQKHSIKTAKTKCKTIKCSIISKTLFPFMS